MSTEDSDAGAAGDAGERSLPITDILQGLLGASQGQDTLPALLGQLLGGGATASGAEKSGLDLEDLLDRIAAGEEPDDATLRATGIPQALAQKADVDLPKVLIIIRELLRLLAAARRPAKKRRRRPQSPKPRPASGTPASTAHAKPKPKPKPKPSANPKPATKPKPKPKPKRTPE